MTYHRLYAILDAEACLRRALSLQEVAEAWRDGGIRLLQYRDKNGTDEEVLQNARMLRHIFADASATLILNDRVHLVAQAGFHGVHIGQTDGSPLAARQTVGSIAVLGISTHTPTQLVEADSGSATYVAIGPVFSTGTKLDAEPVVGLQAVRAARILTKKPLVAIGGITRDNAPEVLAAGANAVAVISGLLPPDASKQQLRKAAQDFLLALQ